MQHLNKQSSENLMARSV